MKRYMTAAICAAALIFMLTACGSTDTVSGDPADPGSSGGEVRLARVLSVSGNQVTLRVSSVTFNDSAMAEEAPPEKPDNSENGIPASEKDKPELPHQSEDDPNASHDGGVQEGVSTEEREDAGFTDSGINVLTLEGEEMTFSFDGVSLTRGGETITASDLKEGDLVILSMDSNGNVTAAAVRADEDGNGPS